MPRVALVNYQVAELEYRLLYSIAVAGKSAEMIRNAMDRLFGWMQENEAPFAAVRRLGAAGSLEKVLREIRIGNYGRLTRGWQEAATAKLDLTTCTPDELEKIHGIGPKTARFFILWTRPDARFAALDTHVLKWLRFIGVAAPLGTPSASAEYASLERRFLAEADARKLKPRELDALIWDWCQARRHEGGVWPEILQPRAA